MNSTRAPKAKPVAWLNTREPRLSWVETCTLGELSALPPTLVIFSTCSVALLIVCTGRFRSRSRPSILCRLCGACPIQL